MNCLVPVSEEFNRSGRLTNSAARTDVVLLIRRTVRPLAPPGVGTRCGRLCTCPAATHQFTF